MMKKDIFYFLLVSFTWFFGSPSFLAADSARKIDQSILPPASAITQTPPDASLPDVVFDQIARFCQNVGDQAQDARFELQLRQLNVMRDEVDVRIKLLEEKRKEYDDWLARRNDFLAKAQDSFVGIISKMRPDAAAAQLALVDEIAAASIIFKLEPRVSSAIMNELQPEKSANLIRILVSAQKVSLEKPSRSTSDVTKNVP
ncbi:MAG: hypothetical protein JSC189_000322 [Candidatus Tokpelaia sp. JSC189]|nr:MAG: hypothetical protein JSC189_000322 [Candidatus Tokpelaia sp. JSC189]